MSRRTRRHLQDKRPRTSLGKIDQVKVRILCVEQKRINTTRNKFETGILSGGETMWIVLLYYELLARSCPALEAITIMY